jgi:ABC-type sugar transport system substrate-binding protein
MSAALALSACGSDDGGGGGGDGEGKIGVILPDTKSSVRWESADRPALTKAFKDAGVEYDIQNAEGDADKMQTIADGMIADGVTVLAIVNLDSDSGAAIEEKAAKQGVKTIDYDRLTLAARPTSTSPTTTATSASSRARDSRSASVRRMPTSSTSTVRPPTTTRSCSPRVRTASSTR